MSVITMSANWIMKAYDINRCKVNILNLSFDCNNFNVGGIGKISFSVCCLMILSGCSGLPAISFFTNWYEGVVGFWLRFIPIVVFILSVAYVKLANIQSKPVLVVTVAYIFGNTIVYTLLSSIYGFHYFGEYHYYCLLVFVWMFALYSLVELAMLKFKRTLTNISTLILILGFCLWSIHIYKLGAGYCWKDGGFVSFEEIVNNISAYEISRISDDSILKKENYTPEKIAKMALEVSFSEYQKGEYMSAIRHLPNVVNYPNGMVSWALDDGQKRVLKAVAFREIAIADRSSKYPYSYYVSNCGDVKSPSLIYPHIFK